MLGDHARAVSASFSDLTLHAQNFERGSTAQTASGMHVAAAAEAAGEQVLAAQETISASVEAAGTMLKLMVSGAVGTEGAINSFMHDTEESRAYEIGQARDRVGRLRERILGEANTMSLVDECSRMATELDEIKALLALASEKIATVAGIAHAIKQNAKPNIGPSITADLSAIASDTERYAAAYGLNIPIPRAVTSTRLFE